MTTPTPVAGNANSYPEGQCTQYADQRYHDLSGLYVPWSGNAKDWAGQSIAYGWSLSNNPIVPSIMCLQPGVQGADAVNGHVGVVESIGANGTFSTSNLNWGSTPSVVASVTFAVGTGVSFIYATSSNGAPLGASSSGILATIQSILTGSHPQLSLGPTADVTALLNTLDAVMLLTNPFAIQNVTTDNLSVLGASVSFTDPVMWIEQLGFNLIDDLLAVLLRAIFLLVGVVLLIKILNNFIDFSAIGNTVKSGVQLGAMLA